MTKIWTRTRAERFIKLCDMCIGRPTTYTEGSMRGSIVRLGILNPQMHSDLHEDCSSDTVGLAFAAGLPDPCGYDYERVGNTTSLDAHLKHCAIDDVRVGDLIRYGHHPDHVTIVIGGKGKDADLYSFGGPPSPQLRHFQHYRNDALWGLIYASKTLGTR